MPVAPCLQGVHDEATCRACTKPLKDAVAATCGHSFCRLCLPPPAQMGAQPSGRMLLCPLCQEEEQAKAPVAPVPLGPLGETYCEEHGEKIYFFCQMDAEFLCALCREGPAHQAHSVAFLDEAIQPYRDRLRSQLEALTMERDKIEDIKCREDQKLQVLLAQIERKKREVAAAFERLQQELGDQQRLLLARLRQLEQQVQQEREEYLSKVSDEVAWLCAQVEELEEKCGQPASALVQDARVNQTRLAVKTAGDSEVISSDLIAKIRDFHRKTLVLPDMMRTFSESLEQHLETQPGLASVGRVLQSREQAPGSPGAALRGQWRSA